MSMHEIESLVEDSVHVVAKSKMTASVKRDYLFNLYRFQSMFDTGYTHFRCIDILLDLKFTYRVPLEKHPDYQDNQGYFDGLDIAKTYWLPTEIGEEGESVYAHKEDRGLFLYADAGSQFWQRLCKENILPEKEHLAPQKFKTAYLIWQLLEEAQQQGNIHLVRDWYACLVNMLGIDLGEEDGFPKLFLDFIGAEEVAGIRAIGKAVNPFAKPYENDDWGYVTRPVLKDIAEEENDTERLFCIKWLLDFKTDEDKLKADYHKAITPDPKREAKLQIIPNAVIFHLGYKNWKLVWDQEYEYGYKWLYYHQLRGIPENPQDTDVHLYLFLDANTEDLKMVYPRIGIQSGLINRWQGREVVHTPESVHFFETILPFIPAKERESNKNLHNMGGWKFSLKSSEKALKSQVENLFDAIEKYGSKATAPFKKPLFKDFGMSLDEALKYREKMQFTHRFFLNQIEVYLVYAFHYFEQGKVKEANKLAWEVKEKALKIEHAIAKDWVAAAESVMQGKPKLNELLSFQRSYPFK